LKLFDQLIKPIALYGSEIWGPDTLKFSAEDCNKFSESLHKFKSEKLNLSFARFILGVHKKSQNSAVRGELGRAPLGIDIAANTVMYLKHLQSDKTSPLLKEAFILNTTMPNGKGWVAKACKVHNYTSKQQSPDQTSNVRMSRRLIKQNLTTEYKTFWTKQIKYEAKMRTYIIYKQSFALEDYLCTLPQSHQKAFTRFRISAHNLAIERGRYTRPPTPLENRICPHCPQKIEDEHHFLLDCTAHQTQRDALLEQIYNVAPQVKNLDDNHKFIYMMSAGGQITKLVARFVFDHIK